MEEEDGRHVWRRSFAIANEGTTAALHVYPEETTGDYWMAANQAYVTIWPGESVAVEVECRPRRGGGLLAEQCPVSEHDGAEPVIGFVHFGSGATATVPREEAAAF